VTSRSAVGAAPRVEGRAPSRLRPPAGTPAPYRLAGARGVPVEAYALRWDHVVPVVSRSGVPYFQSIDRHALDEHLAEMWRARDYGISGPYANHCLSGAGAPSGVLAKPLGVTAELIADEVGLRTVAYYHDSVLADRVLAMIGSGEAPGQSVRLRVVEPVDMSAVLPYQVLTVTKARLIEYGPALEPADLGARFLSVGGIPVRQRSAWVDDLRRLARQADQVRALATDLEHDRRLTANSTQRRGQRRGHRYARQQPAPALRASRGWTDSRRWSAEHEARREAERLDTAVEALLREHGWTAA
jgi:hypothetical protein